MSLCSQGTSVCQVTLIGVMVVLLYSSRACYNLVVLALADIENLNSFDYDWYNVSDQVGLVAFVAVLLGSCGSVLVTLSSALRRRTYGRRWGTPVMSCSGSFCSSGSCCQPRWSFSSSGSDGRLRKG